MTVALRPPFAYYGGKTTLAERIAALLPEHKHYVEPLSGSLAVLLAKAPAPMETVNNLDGELMTFWRVLREQADDLMRVCSLTPHSRAEYQAASPDLDSAPGPTSNALAASGSPSRKAAAAHSGGTGWRYFEDPGRRGPISMPVYLTAYVRRIGAASLSERLAGVSLECRPALEVITAYGKHDSVCIYADPPYLGSTRSSRQYAVEMSHDHEHEQLAEALTACRAAIVLSGYDSPLYRRLYGDWNRIEIAAFTGQANTNGRRSEVLWSNRPLAHAETLDFTDDDDEEGLTASG